MATTLFHTYSPVRSSILLSLYNLGAIQSLQILGEKEKWGFVSEELISWASVKVQGMKQPCHLHDCLLSFVLFAKMHL